MTTFITRTQLNALRSDVPPANHGKPWTAELKAELAEAFAQGKSLKELMDQFQRNNNGIVGMLSTLRFIGYDIRTNAYNITHIGAKRMQEKVSHPPPTEVSYFTTEDYELIDKVLALAQENRDGLLACLEDVGVWTLELSDPNYSWAPVKFLWLKCVDAGLNIYPVIDKVWAYVNLLLAHQFGYPINEKFSWWCHEVKKLKGNGVYPLAEPKKQIDYVPGPHDDYVDALNYELSALCNTVNAAPSLTTLIKEGNIAMNPNSTNVSLVAFETRHYVFGQDINNLSAGQLIEAVKRVEGEIADLKSVKTKSTHITNKVKELEGMLAKIVEQLDSK